MAQSPKDNPGPVNKLSAEENKEGWQLLFNGQNTDGWRGVYAKSFPAEGWQATDGTLLHKKAEGAESKSGGDIVTMRSFKNFILSAEYKISEGGNSGIKYRVREEQPRPEGSAKGLEYQILDDDNHPDAKLGTNGNRRTASLYDLVPRDMNTKPNPPGEWNHAVILFRNGQGIHFLNKQMVASFDLAAPEFEKHFSQSKFIKDPGRSFIEGTLVGHILLQDHGDEVAFRNIKILELDDQGQVVKLVDGVRPVQFQQVAPPKMKPQPPTSPTRSSPAKKTGAKSRK